MKNFTKMAITATALVLSVFMVWANIINEIEPGNDTTPQIFMIGDTIRGEISTLPDQDNFKATMSPGMYKFTQTYPAGIQEKDWVEIKNAQGIKLPMDCYWPNANTLVSYFKVCTTQEVFVTVLANQNTGLIGAPYELTVAAVPEDPNECNDTNATARTVTDAGVQQGMFPVKNDPDVFRFSAEAGVFGFAANTPQQSSLPFKIELYEGNSTTPLASTASGFDLNTNLPNTGIYYLKLDYAQDTNAQFPYSASFLFTPAPFVSCDTAIVGVIDIQKQGKTITLNLSQVFVDSLSINWGDGTVSDSLTHTYALNGNYTITITAFNACSSATATTTTSILTAKFKMVWVENQLPGTPAKVAFVCEEGEVQAANMEASLMTNWGKLSFVGMEDGKLKTAGLVKNTDPTSPGYGRIAGTFNANGSETISQGDTLFYFLFDTQNAQKGDSIPINLNGALQFAFYAFVLGNPELVDSQVTPGGIEFVKDINLKISIQTPTFIPVDSVEVTITTIDTTIIAFTNANGLLEITIPYSTGIVINCKKIKQVLGGISSVDAFKINRVIVLLPVSGATQYSFIAADFDCTNTISTLDAVKILQYLVGITNAPPCDQLVFIDKAYQFPPYTGQASYFTGYPTTINLNNANPNATAELAFTCVIRGDFDGNASPNFGGEPTIEDRSMARMNYQAIQEGSQTRVLLTPEAGLAIATGQFSLDIPKGYVFKSAKLVQGNQSCALQAFSPTEGRVNVAFSSLDGNNIPRDMALPLIEIILEGTGTFDMSFATNGGLDALIADKHLNISAITMERNNTPSLSDDGGLNFKVFPNPVSDVLRVSLPALSDASIEILDPMGRVVLTQQAAQVYQLELPVVSLPVGQYFLRVRTTNQVFQQAFAKK